MNVYLYSGFELTDEERARVGRQFPNFRLVNIENAAEQWNIKGPLVVHAEEVDMGVVPTEPRLGGTILWIDPGHIVKPATVTLPSCYLVVTSGNWADVFYNVCERQYHTSVNAGEFANKLFGGLRAYSAHTMSLDIQKLHNLWLSFERLHREHLSKCYVCSVLAQQQMSLALEQLIAHPNPR